MPSAKEYDTLCISGGSVRGIYGLGALHYLSLKNKLNYVTNYIGTSIGSIICYLMAIGYSPMEIIIYICQFNILDQMKSFDIVELIRKKSLLDFYPIQKMIEDMTIDRIGEFLTFKQLKDKYNKVLVCTTYNYTHGKVEYINHETHPDIPCIVGLKMSCSVPLIFEPYRYMNSQYLDGGLADNFPLKYFDKDPHRIIGIFMSDIHNPNREPNDLDNDNLLGYITKIISVPYQELSVRTIGECEKNGRCEIVTIHNEIDFMNFNLSVTDKLNMFSAGYRSTRLKYEGPTEEEKMFELFEKIRQEEAEKKEPETPEEKINTEQIPTEVTQEKTVSNQSPDQQTEKKDE